MNMLNKCAKFHKDSPSDKKVKFNLPCAIELSETAVFCVQLCIETLCKWATSVAHLTNFSFEFFYEIFTADAYLSLLYHGAKKSKMTKNSNQGGGVLMPAPEQPCSPASSHGRLSFRPVIVATAHAHAVKLFVTVLSWDEAAIYNLLLEQYWLWVTTCVHPVYAKPWKRLASDICSD